MEVYETVDLGSNKSRNVEYLGAFVAWLTINDLWAKNVEWSASNAISRVRMQDLTGPEFLTTVLHGELRANQLTEQGRDFVEHYFVSGQYRKDYDACQYDGNDEWVRYDEIAPRITAAFRAFTAPAGKLRSTAAKIIQFPGRFRK
ncbi:MAG: hypothetical protein HUJ31_14675 [Pseudomonadales bacterium]|nr:hypothetical protein [Pseudomonadales bacterium]